MILLWQTGVASTPTEKLPGALRAAVQPHPRYRPKPSSSTMRKTPRPLKASGFVCLLIFKTSTESSDPEHVSCQFKIEGSQWQYVELSLTGKEDNLSDTDERACKGACDRFAVFFAESANEAFAVVAGEIVIDKGLSTEFVDLRREALQPGLRYDDS